MTPKIKAFHKIVETKQLGKVEKTPIDLFSACHVMLVWKNLNEDNRRKFESLPVPLMVSTAYRVTAKASQIAAH